jgi:hypothetical protein
MLVQDANRREVHDVCNVERRESVEYGKVKRETGL